MLLDASGDSKQPAADAPAASALFAELDPEPRLLMGPGPVDVYPRVLRAMSVALQGQFDPQFTVYMNQVCWSGFARRERKRARTSQWVFRSQLELRPQLVNPALSSARTRWSLDSVFTENLA